MSQSELARRLCVDPKEVRRMLNSNHSTKLSRMSDALAILGKRPVVGVQAA